MSDQSNEPEFWAKYNTAIKLDASRLKDKLLILSDLYRECSGSDVDDEIKEKRLQFISNVIAICGGEKLLSHEQIDEEAQDAHIFRTLSSLSLTFSPLSNEKQDLGIIVFAHTRADELKNTLTSLQKQNALSFTEVWFDGHQGKQQLCERIDRTISIASEFPVKQVHHQKGNYGFRKMILMALLDMSRRYRDILVLEDDCFPTKHAVSTFKEELDSIRDDPSIFSTYGAHFRVPGELPLCTRFQGWGWATTSEKLQPLLRMLAKCYSLNEAAYLTFVDSAMTDDVVERLEVTPGRQPSQTLRLFFAWDETLALLTAMRGQFHKPTPTQVIYNCGLGGNSTHFPDKPKFREAPFNMILPSEVWDMF